MLLLLLIIHFQSAVGIPEHCPNVSVGTQVIGIRIIYLRSAHFFGPWNLFDFFLKNSPIKKGGAFQYCLTSPTLPTVPQIIGISKLHHHGEIGWLNTFRFFFPQFLADSFKPSAFISVLFFSGICSNFSKCWTRGGKKTSFP